MAERRSFDATVERELLQGLLRVPELVAEAKAMLAPEDFHDPTCAAIARWLWAGGKGEPEESGAAATVRELVAVETEDFDWQREAQGRIRRMRVGRLHRELRDTRHRIQGARDQEEMTRLMREADEIARSLKELTEA